MSRLIDADALLDEVDAVFGSVMSKKITDLITNAPTVQREHKYCGRKIDLSYGSTNCGSDFHGSIMKCDDCASEPTVQREGWVSVDDRLPDRKGYEANFSQSNSVFIFCAKNRKVLIARLEAFGDRLMWMTNSNYPIEEVEKVTHWQYLPAAPKE